MKNKKLFAILTLVCFLFTLMPMAAFADDSTKTFSDVQPSDWYYNVVQYAAKEGIMTGTGDNTFSPNATLTRATLMTVLYRMEGSPDAVGKNPFKDVADGQWYTEAIVWAATNKIAGGYSADTFGPNDPLTREQLAAFMQRYAVWKGIDVSVGENTNILSYDDAFIISDWAYGALQWACGAGLIGSVGDGKLDPQGTATRAQLAAIMQRFDEKVLTPAEEKKEETKKPSYSGGGSSSGGSSTPSTPVTPENVAVTGVTLNKTEIALTVGNTETLIATVTPDNATNKAVTWSSDNTSVASVDANGVVTAVAEGTATITATAGEKSATCAVTVNSATVPVTGITLNMATATLTTTTGNSITLVATVTPDNATDKAVTWSSNNTSVAIVDGDGVVTGVTTGSAIITATAGSFDASCEIEVVEYLCAEDEHEYVYESIDENTHKVTCKNCEYEVVVDCEFSYDTAKVVNGLTFEACVCGNIGEKIYVSSDAELSKALTAGEESITVVLMNDINLPITSLGTITPSSGEYKLGGENTNSITIDLNGKKLNITTTYWSAIGAKNADATITIKNGSMTSTGNSAGTWNAWDVRFSNCDYVIEDVTFDKAIAFDNAAHKATLTNVTINETNDYYAMWITAEGQEIEIDGLTINSDGRGIKIDEQYVDDPAKVTLSVSNADFNTAKKAAIMVKSEAGADITLSNVDVEDVVADSENEVWVDEDSADYQNLVTVNGGNKILEGAVAKIGTMYYGSLQEAVDAAGDNDTVILMEDITDDVTITQKADVKFTIDGANKKFSGVMTVDGKSARYETAGVTIQNVNFEADSISADAYIRLGVSGNNDTRYTNNVTVKDCTFSGTGLVAVKSYTGGDLNLTLDGLTVNEGMHSLLQVTNVEQGLKIIDCKVYSKNGANLNNTPSLEMSGCNFDVIGYAVRIGVSGTVNSEEKTFTISNSTLKSDGDDGDTAIVFRNSATYATLTLTNVTLSDNAKFKGNTENTTIIINGVLQKTAATQEDLNSALTSSDNEVEVALSAGNYTLPSVSNGEVTISGTEETVITVTTPAYHGSDVTFEGVTIKGSGAHTGIQHVNTVTYNDVTINGEMNLYGEKVIFNGCEFNLAKGQYLWTYGAKEVEFINCIFNTAGKAILIYKDGGLIDQKITVTGCTFNATQGDTAGAITNQNCAAIEIHNYMSNITLVTGNNTVDTDFSGEWRIKQYDTTHSCTIKVNDIVYTDEALDGTILNVVNKVVQ